MAPGICRMLAGLLAFARILLIHTVVCSIFVPADQLLGTEKITVGASADFIDGLAQFIQLICLLIALWSVTYRWVKIDEDGTGNIFAAGCFSKKSLVGSVLCGLVGSIWIGEAIGLQTVFK